MTTITGGPDGRVKFGILAWNQYTDWPALERVGARIEELGYDSAWTWDHLYPIVGSWRGPIFEGYMTLAAWACRTERVALGLMVGANTFRNPALVAKMITTLDHISRGRAVLGIGAAWFETEHRAYGIPFGESPGERLNWLDEAVELMRGMLDQEEASARGRFYHASSVRNDPRPFQDHLPILIGGAGERKTLRTTAKYADAWNTGGDLEKMRHKDEVLRRWCDEFGRDESEIERTYQGGNVVVRDTVEDARQVAQEIGRINGGSRGPQPVTPDQLVERLVPIVELGFRHVYFDSPAPYDDETLERLITEVKPAVERAVGVAA